METKLKKDYMIAAKVSKVVYDKIEEAKRLTDLSTRQLIERALFDHFRYQPKLQHLVKEGGLFGDMVK